MHNPWRSKGREHSEFLSTTEWSPEHYAQLNILVTPASRACLADFGLATARDSKPIIMSSMSSNRTTGTLRWQAPELLNPESDEGDGRNNMSSDVYAFACVCYEVKSILYFKLPA